MILDPRNRHLLVELIPEEEESGKVGSFVARQL
jgi:hypothetical protein